MIAIQFPSVELAELALERFRETYIAVAVHSCSIGIDENVQGALVTISACCSDDESWVESYLRSFLPYGDLDVTTIAYELAVVANWPGNEYHHELGFY